MLMVANGTKRTTRKSHAHKPLGPKTPKKIRKPSKAPRGPAFAVNRHAANQEVTFTGRPSWTTEATAISVNQDPLLGEVEDRRHLLHWDEQLKPILSSVFTAMQKEFKPDPLLLAELQRPLRERHLRTQARTIDEYMLFVAKAINGSPGNLVPDRADINKAIEIVRGNVRSYANDVHQDSDYRDDVSALPAADARSMAPKAVSRMDGYKAKARKHLITNDTLTPIKSRVSEIQAQLLDHIDGCHAPHELWTLLHDLEYSVSFDLSAKATRDKTGKSLLWQRKMAASEAWPARERYKALLTFLD